MKCFFYNCFFYFCSVIILCLNFEWKGGWYFRYLRNDIKENENNKDKNEMIWRSFYLSGLGII